MIGHPSQRAFKSVFGIVVTGGLLVSLVGCAADQEPGLVRNLDRPTAVAFSCYGDLRITEGAPTDPSQDIIVSAQPTASCASHAKGDGPLPGQEDGPVVPDFAGFVLQGSKGTVAVVEWSVTLGLVGGEVQDNDPLAPGKNSIPIGTLPVDIASTPDGCHVVTANAGSCDLSVMDVGSALDLNRPAQVSRIGIQATGGPLLAKPHALVAEPPASDAGFRCADTADTLIYISYPACNLVAAVDASTGDVLAGIQFADNGVVTITDGDVSCPAQCGGSALPTPRLLPGPGPVNDADRPAALEMTPDGARLFIAASNNPAITIVNLDANRLPVSTTRRTVEGSVGLGKIAVSPVIPMGSSLGFFDEGSAGLMQFVYAVASDRTVRVLEVLNVNTECDTQVDPRVIHDVTDATLLSCIPVGSGYRRRPNSLSAGIHLPDRALPLDITFSAVENEKDDAGDPVKVDVVAPVNMVGHFAFISTGSGYVYVVNVDDDKALDFEDAVDVTATSMTLATAHQLRDYARFRDSVSGINSAEQTDNTRRCNFPGSAVNEMGPRIALPVNIGVIPDAIAPNDQLHMLPRLRQDLCVDDDLQTTVSELSFMADLAQRELAYPDLSSVRNEQWAIVWEGILSEDDSSQNIDGPQIRLGVVDAVGGVHVRDSSSPFCSMGVESYDIVTLVGCDPTRGDSECGIGETCYLHPDSPPNTRGMCLDSTNVDQLSGQCKDVLISRRRYSVVDTFKDRLSLVERRRVLRTTPLEGCTDDTQCVDYAKVEAGLSSVDHPFNRVVTPDSDNWACVADPSRAAGPNTCQMTCGQAGPDGEPVGCESGWHCSNNFCVEAPLPPAACIKPLQRYGVSVGNALRVLGSSSGYLHNRIADPGTGECVENPAGNPLLVGRIPLQAPPCLGDGLDDLSPNPCTTTVNHTEEFVPYEFTGTECPLPLDENGNLITELRTRAVSAIRFRNPGLTFHLVDPVTSGDLECHGDRLGTRTPFPTIYPGFQLTFTVTGGAAPMFVGELRDNGERQRIAVAFPSNIVTVPDGTIWVVDQGDILNINDPTRGRVVSIDPSNAAGNVAGQDDQIGPQLDAFDPRTVR